MTAFEAMTTVINFANVTMGTGEIDVAQQNYIDAKFLFTKLGNDRGVSRPSTRCALVCIALNRAGQGYVHPLVSVFVGGAWRLCVRLSRQQQGGTACENVNIQHAWVRCEI